MELTAKELMLVTQICELSTKLNTSISADDLQGTDAPKEAILQIRSFTRSAYITKDQLAAAKRALRIIYNANRKFLKPGASEISDTGESNLSETHIPESFTPDDVISAINLGVYATKANVEVRIHRNITDDSNGYIAFKSVDAHIDDQIPFKYLRVVSKIFEVVCANNQDFKSQQDD